MVTQKVRGVTKLQVTIIAAIIIIAVIASAYYLLTQTPAPQPPEAPEEILIGASLPLTGPLAFLGSQYSKGYNWAVEYINENGGVYVEEFEKKIPLKLILYDDESQATRSVSIVERLIQVDMVDFLLGPSGSTLVYAASAIAELNKVPMVSPSGWSDKIFEREFKYIFCPQQYASDVGAKLIDQMKELLGDELQTIAIAFPRNEYHTYIAMGAERGALRNGLTILLYEGYPPGTTDFSSLMVKLQALGQIDLFFSNAYYAENLAVIRALMTYDVNPKALFLYGGPETASFMETVGEEAMDYVFRQDPWPARTVNPFSNAIPEGVHDWFIDKCDEEGEPPEDNIIFGFDAVTILADAIERAGTLDREDVRDALAQTDSVYLRGPVKFDDKGMNTMRSYFADQYQLAAGDWVSLTPSEWATGTIKYPAPTWAEKGVS